MAPLPRISLSVQRSDRLAVPKIRFSPACVFRREILSSVESSQNSGIDLAHSTSSRSCCFIESAISLASAIFCGWVSVTWAPIWNKKLIYLQHYSDLKSRFICRIRSFFLNLLYLASTSNTVKFSWKSLISYYRVIFFFGLEHFDKYRQVDEFLKIFTINLIFPNNIIRNLKTVQSIKKPSLIH